MDKEIIIRFLKGKLPKLQGSYLDGVAETYSKIITKEEEIETILNEGVINLIKYSAETYLQAEADRRAQDAVKKYEEKYSLKDGKVVDKQNPVDNPQKPTNQNVPDDAPDYVKSLLEGINVLTEQNKGLAEKVAALETGKKQEQNALSVAEAIKASTGIPDKLKDKWAKRLNPDSDTSLEDQVKELEEEYAELHTEIAGDTFNPGLENGNTSDGTISDEEAKTIIEQMN